MRVDCCDAAHPCSNSAVALQDSRGGGSATLLQQFHTRSRRCWQTPRRPSDPSSTARQKRTGTRDICIPVDSGLDGTLRRHMPASPVPLLVLVSAASPLRARQRTPFLCFLGFHNLEILGLMISRNQSERPADFRMAEHHPLAHDGGKAAEGNAEGKAGSAGGVQMCTCVRVTHA